MGIVITFSRQAYNQSIWRTSCAVLAIPAIHTPTASAAAPLDVVSQLPDVQADGKGINIGDRICTGDHAGYSPLLRNLSGCAIHYFHLAQQCNRWRQPVPVDRQRQ